MYYHEEKQDLFTVDESYALAHCISADLALGAGIAVEFQNRFNIRTILQNMYPNGYIKMGQLANYGAIYIYIGADTSNGSFGRDIINIVTKKEYWQKPTMSSMTSALSQVRSLCVEHNIKKLAIPKIGCGLDRLTWVDVRRVIKELFSDLDIEIMVCEL